jgi:hypothetical protein
VKGDEIMSKQKDFDALFAEYQKEVESYSGGLTTTNKSDFLRMYSFYKAVVLPDVEKVFEYLTSNR